jgi:AraC-like DNA-binding protein
VWRPADFEGIELRSGVAVSEPYPRHWHEEYQLCFIQAGGGELFYQGTHHSTPQTSLFIVHPGEVHSNQTNIGCSFHSIYIEPEFIRRLVSTLTDQGQPALPFFPDPIVFDPQIIRQYLELQSALTTTETQLRKESIMLALLAKLVSRYAQSRVDLGVQKTEQPVIKKITDYIVENHVDNIQLKELASYANLSPFHLTRAFTRQIGMPPHAFHLQVRIGNAKKLLRNGFSPAHVAAMTGFADQSHFNRHFKRLTKITPGEYSKTARTFNTESSR